MLIFLTWIALSVAVGMFAHIRRNRHGAGWFVLALLISPVLAGIFVAILQPAASDVHITLHRRNMPFDQAYTPFDQLPSEEQQRLAKFRNDLQYRVDKSV